MIAQDDKLHPCLLQSPVFLGCSSVSIGPGGTDAAQLSSLPSPACPSVSACPGVPAGPDTAECGGPATGSSPVSSNLPWGLSR